MTRCFKMGVAATIFIGAFEADAADWPCWRGPDRNGISSETGLSWQWETNRLPVLWKAAVGKGFSSFAVAAGREQNSHRNRRRTRGDWALFSGRACGESHLHGRPDSA